MLLVMYIITVLVSEEDGGYIFLLIIIHACEATNCRSDE